MLRVKIRYIWIFFIFNITFHETLKIKKKSATTSSLLFWTLVMNFHSVCFTFIAFSWKFLFLHLIGSCTIPFISSLLLNSQSFNQNMKTLNRLIYCCIQKVRWHLNLNCTLKWTWVIAFIFRLVGLPFTSVPSFSDKNWLVFEIRYVLWAVKNELFDFYNV